MTKILSISPAPEEDLLGKISPSRGQFHAMRRLKVKTRSSSRTERENRFSRNPFTEEFFVFSEFKS